MGVAARSSSWTSWSSSWRFLASREGRSSSEPTSPSSGDPPFASSSASFAAIKASASSSVGTGPDLGAPEDELFSRLASFLFFSSLLSFPSWLFRAFPSFSSLRFLAFLRSGLGEVEWWCFRFLSFFAFFSFLAFFSFFSFLAFFLGALASSLAGGGGGGGVGRGSGLGAGLGGGLALVGLGVVVGVGVDEGDGAGVLLLAPPQLHGVLLGPAFGGHALQSPSHDA